jgi:hypothetical protein
MLCQSHKNQNETCAYCAVEYENELNKSEKAELERLIVEKDNALKRIAYIIAMEDDLPDNALREIDRVCALELNSTPESIRTKREAEQRVIKAARMDTKSHNCGKIEGVRLVWRINFAT